MEFYDATSSGIYGGALRALRRPARAEAATRAAYAMLWQTSAGFDPARCTLESWILVATLHAVVGQMGC